MYVTRVLREARAEAADVRTAEQVTDVLLDALATDPAVKAAVRRLTPAAASASARGGGRRG